MNRIVALNILLIDGPNSENTLAESEHFKKDWIGGTGNLVDSTWASLAYEAESG